MENRILDLYPGLPQPKEHPQHEYNQSYSITTLILLFFTFSVIGWVWEVALFMLNEGTFVNRGTMFGPWLPIYGTGGLLALVLLRKFFKNPILTFFAMMVISGLIEYFTSYYLEVTRGVKWWDYSGYFLNLDGRICLEGLIVFGLGGCACIYYVAPLLNNIFEKISQKLRIPLCVILVALFIFDSVYSHFYPNMGKGITDFPETSYFRYNTMVKKMRL